MKIFKNLKAIIVVAMSFLIFGTVGTMLLQTIFGVQMGSASIMATPSGVFSMLFAFIFPLVAILIWNKFVDKAKLSEIGFNFKNPIKDYVIGFVVAVIFQALILLVAGCFSAFSFEVDSNIKVLYIIISLLGFGIQGFTEEVLCRGYLLNKVAKNSGVVAGVILNSLVFAALHSGNNSIKFLPVLNLIVFGIVFSLIFLLTDSIIFAGAAHTAWNFMLGPVMGIEVSGTRFFTSIFKTTRAAGADLISGGSFGLEGSILTTVFGILISIILFILIKRKKTIA